MQAGTLLSKLYFQPQPNVFFYKLLYAHHIYSHIETYKNLLHNINNILIGKVLSIGIKYKSNQVVYSTDIILYMLLHTNRNTHAFSWARL